MAEGSGAIGQAGGDLAGLLSRKNGFYAFESALYVRPYDPYGSAIDLAAWNRPDLWRDRYGSLADGFFFFAEDVFGVQFAYSEERIVTFDPETGETAEVADDLEGWAAVLLEDYEVLTGHSIAHQWQQLHGALPPGYRLLPKRPFVLGGEFDVSNLYACPDVNGMRLRGDLASQLDGLPEGASVSFRIVD